MSISNQEPRVDAKYTRAYDIMRDAMEAHPDWSAVIVGHWLVSAGYRGDR